MGVRHSGLLRLRNHPAGKDEFLGFSIPTNFWQYGVNAAYTHPCFGGLANPKTIGKYHLYTATGFVYILRCCSLSKPMAQSNTGGMQ
jgi:hypothetical protein